MRGCIDTFLTEAEAVEAIRAAHDDDVYRGAISLMCGMGEARTAEVCTLDGGEPALRISTYSIMSKLGAAEHDLYEQVVYIESGEFQTLRRLISAAEGWRLGACPRGSATTEVVVAPEGLTGQERGAE